MTIMFMADTGILFRSPEAVKAAYPQFPVTETYEALKEQILAS